MKAREQHSPRIGPRLLFLICSFVILFAGESFAQTMQAFEEYGVGPRDAGLGNAYTGVADDFAATFYNPAGLTQISGTHLTVGYKILDPQVYARVGSEDKDRFTDYPSTQWGLFGFTTDLHVPEIVNPKYTDPFVFGLVLALSRYVHSYTTYYDETIPYFFRYHDRPVALLSLYCSLGVRLSRWLSLGGGIVVAPSTTSVDARTYTDVYLPEGNFVSSQGITNRTRSVVKPLFSVLFRIPLLGEEDGVRIGVTWRDQVEVVDGRGVAKNRIILHSPGDKETIEPVPPQVVSVDNMTGFSPMQVLAGISIKPYRGALVAADTVWKRWSAWENFLLQSPSPRFHDTLQERLGIEQRFSTEAAWLEHWSLRGGYYFEVSPVPDQDGEGNILDNDKQVFTGGLGLRVDRVFGVLKTPVNLDAGGQLHLLEKRKINNDRDSAYPKIETGGRLYSATLSLELEW